MPGIRRLVAALVCFAALIGFALPAAAEERINDYRINIHLQSSGILDVTEEMQITSEGLQIIHGIDRAIPLSFDGHRSRSSLKVIEVERDGVGENFEVLETGPGAIIRIGSSDRTLSSGVHRYKIRYEIDRAISFSNEGSRFHWNANGTDGLFAIDALHVEITLPQGVTPLSADVHTGFRGQTGKDATSNIAGNIARFTTTRPYAPGENSTIDLRLPNGAIQPPDSEQLREWWYRDYGSAAFGAAIVIVAAIIAMLLVLLFGRNPPAGIIVPRWTLPEGVSPGTVNYVVSRNFKTGFWQGLSASVVALAVKGQVVIDKTADGVGLRKTSKNIDDIPPGEAAILSHIPDAGSLTLGKANAAETLTLGNHFESAVTSEIGETYYRSNAGIAVCFYLAFWVAWLVYDQKYTIGSEYPPFVPLPLHFLLSIIPWALFFKSVEEARKILFNGNAIWHKYLIVQVYFVLAVLSIYAAVEIMFVDDPTQRNSFLVACAVACITTLLSANIGRMSRAGRDLMDSIAGLERYLTLVEKDRLALTAAPDLSPAHYERLLPFAIALGVERAWNRQFEIAMAAASAAGHARDYDPTWCPGSATGDFTQVFAVGSLISAVAIEGQSSANSQDDSGSSNGSGGGHGGGGVGGW